MLLLAAVEDTRISGIERGQPRIRTAGIEGEILAEPRRLESPSKPLPVFLLAPGQVDDLEIGEHRRGRTRRELERKDRLAHRPRLDHFGEAPVRGHEALGHQSNKAAG